MAKKAQTVVIEEERQSLLISQRRKYPQVFKWKVAAIIIGVLMVIFLAIDIFMVVYLNQHQLRKTNYSFTVEMIDTLADSGVTAKQFANMMGGLAKSYDELWFQKSKLVGHWNEKDSVVFDVTHTVNYFKDKVTDRFTLLKIRDETTKNEFLLGAYTHVPFTVPEAWDDYLINKDKQYYTFQIGTHVHMLDDRQSTIVGGNSQTYLKMDASDQDLTQCKVITLSEKKLNLLEGLNIDLMAGPTFLTLVNLPEAQSACFSSNTPTGNYLSWLKSAVGQDIDTINYTLVDFYTFELKTD